MEKIGKYLAFILILVVIAIYIPELDLLSDSKDSTAITGDLDVYFIDVGQGDSAFIRTPGGSTILIDGGDNHAGETVLSFLQGQGVEELDIVIATHPHADHIGGLIPVIETLDIGAVYMPRAVHTSKTFERLVLAVKEKGLKFKPAYAGVELDLEDVKARFVGPKESDDYEDLNNSSAVLRLVYGDVDFIFTGDAEREAEEEMLSSGERLGAQVLKVGHHGSVTSTTEEFLDAVSPKYGIISCGQDNKYGHPHVEIMERLNARGIDIYRTDEHGTIHIVCNGKTIEVK